MASSPTDTMPTQATDPSAATDSAHRTPGDITGKAPFLTITRGNPDDTEVAALTMVFASLAAAAEQQRLQDAERNLWGDPAQGIGRPVLFNPNAFRNVTFF